MALLKKKTFTPCYEIQLNMEKKEIKDKSSSKCELLDWLEKVEMEEGVKKETKEDLKRKRRSYDKLLGLIQKEMKLRDGLEECNLEENRTE